MRAPDKSGFHSLARDTYGSDDATRPNMAGGETLGETPDSQEDSVRDVNPLPDSASPIMAA
ncbi:unnamed protein product [Prunus armeniaca]|nr:unnamed protein product [Prunus armeniaca]